MHQCWMEGMGQLMGILLGAAYAEVCEPLLHVSRL